GIQRTARRTRARADRAAPVAAPGDAPGALGPRALDGARRHWASRRRSSHGGPATPKRVTRAVPLGVGCCARRLRGCDKTEVMGKSTLHTVASRVHGTRHTV